MRRKVPDYNPRHALRRTPLSGVAPRVLKPSLLALHLHLLFCIWDQRPQFSCLRPCLLFLQSKRAWPLFEAKEIFPESPTPVSFFEGYAPTELLSQFLPVLINHTPGYQLENETQVWFNIYFRFSLFSKRHIILECTNPCLMILAYYLMILPNTLKTSTNLYFQRFPRSLSLAFFSLILLTLHMAFSQ